MTTDPLERPWWDDADGESVQLRFKLLERKEWKGEYGSLSFPV
jgi:hypothetical protein